MFDWCRFFDSISVEYLVGPASNVRRDHVGIDCPKCAGDQKKHFSINLATGKVRGCWRDKGHWMSAVDLICYLGGVSRSRAIEMLKTDEFPVEVNMRTLARQLDELGSRESKDLEQQTWPEGFERFGRGLTKRARSFVEYLEGRGFEDGDAARAGLRWCDRAGDWMKRIMFPLFADDVLVGWTGRSIIGSKLRYRLHPAGDTAAGLIWNDRGAARLEQKRVLVVCEGTFDAWKIHVHGEEQGVTAVAILTTGAGPLKLGKIVKAARGFERVVVLLDRGAEAQAMDLCESLQVIAPTLESLPRGVKDPGELSRRQVLELVEGWLG
jgi:hypothetical protein